jgi:glycosyltransferase involved in cell wall biosynthesis
MKIAFLTRNYPPESFAGDARIYHELARGLSKRGCEVHVICQAVGKPKDVVEEGVFVHRVGTNPRRYNAFARLNYNFHAWVKLKELIKRYGIQIVEAPDWSAEGFLYSLWKETPLVITALGATDDVIKMRGYSDIRKLASLKVLTYLVNLTYTKADKVVAISKSAYEAVIQRSHTHPRKVAMVPIGVETGKFQFTMSDIKQRLGIPNSVNMVLFVGRLEYRNGVSFLCEAIPQIIERLPDTKFVLVGRDTDTAPWGGSFKHYIMKKAYSHNFQRDVLLIEFLPDDELVQLYSASDICVYPALTSTFGLPVVEAMACGKPVVATPVGIVPALEGQAGGGLTVVPIEEPAKLAEAIINYFSLKQEDREIIAKRNRDIIESQFSIPAWVDKVIEVYAGLL